MRDATKRYLPGILKDVKMPIAGRQRATDEYLYATVCLAKRFTAAARALQTCLGNTTDGQLRTRYSTIAAGN